MKAEFWGDSNSLGVCSVLDGTWEWQGVPRMAPPEWEIVRRAVGGTGSWTGLEMVNGTLGDAVIPYQIPDVVIIGYNGGLDSLVACAPVGHVVTSQTGIPPVYLASPENLVTAEVDATACRVLNMLSAFKNSGIPRQRIILTRGMGFGLMRPEYVGHADAALLALADLAYETFFARWAGHPPILDYRLTESDHFASDLIHASTLGYQVIGARAVTAIEAALDV